MPPQILTDRALNRALLARQHLLERSSMTPAAMIEHLVGLQSQVPQQPYVALWSRLAGFEPAQLERLALDRAVVRIPGIRTTIHLHTAGDALRIRPLLQPVLEKVFRTTSFGKAVADLPLDELLTHGTSLLAETPMAASELGRRLRERWPDHDAGSMAQAVHYLTPVLQPTPRGLWSTTARATWTTVEAWLGRPVAEPHPIDAYVLRYLAAFGPASVADCRTWSWLTGLREVFERLRPQLVTFRDQRGRELFDLLDAPRPPGDVAAPPRFLPEYDNIALSLNDRSRIIGPAAIGRLSGFVGSFTIDGFVAGQWRVDRGKALARLIVDPFVDLDDAACADLLAEAEALLQFHASGPALERRVEFGTARKPTVNPRRSRRRVSG